MQEGDCTISDGCFYLSCWSLPTRGEYLIYPSAQDLLLRLGHGLDQIRGVCIWAGRYSPSKPVPNDVGPFGGFQLLPQAQISGHCRALLKDF